MLLLLKFRINKMGIKEKIYKKSVGKSKEIEVDGKKIYLKKTGMIVKDWQKINPAVELKDGKLEWNYLNLFVGGKKNLINLILIFLLLSVAYYQFSILLGDAKEYMDGSKYVIMKKESFSKYCSMNILSGDLPDYGIMTNFNINKDG